jgi:hypothetical protein
MTALVFFGFFANFLLAILIMAGACVLGGALAAGLLRFAELSPSMEE